MKTFNEILPQTLKNIGLKKRYNNEYVILHWREIVGPDIYFHTRASMIYHGVLTVKVSNSSWAHHLMTIKQEIINKINSFIGEKVINDIKFQAGYLKNDQNQENTNEKDHYFISLKQVVLETEAVNKADNIVGILTTEKLRKKVRRIILKQEALKKVRASLKWHECKSCGILCPPETELCTVCGINLKNENHDKIRKLLIQAPWLDHEELKNYIECHVTEFNTIKRNLSDSLINEIRHLSADDIKIATLVMLINNLKPDMLTKDIIEKTLNKIRGKKNVSTSRS